jgi:hypothetical protein
MKKTTLEQKIDDLLSESGPAEYPRHLLIEELKQLAKTPMFWLRIYIQPVRGGERILYKEIPWSINLEVAVTKKENADKYIDILNKLFNDHKTE